MDIGHEKKKNVRYERVYCSIYLEAPVARRGRGISEAQSRSSGEDRRASKYGGEDQPSSAFSISSQRFSRHTSGQRESAPLGEGFGRFLLIIMTVGLLSFALWSLIQAVFDTEHKGRKAKGIVARVGYAGVALSYGLLGLGATQIASTSFASSRNSTSSAQNWTGLLLKQPAGVLLVILVGCVVLGISASFFVRAYRASFAHYLSKQEIQPNKQTAFRTVEKWSILYEIQAHLARD